MEKLKEKITWTGTKVLHKLFCEFSALAPESKLESKLKLDLRRKAGELQAAQQDAEVTGQWQSYLRDLREQLIFGDPRFFLNWPAVRASMFNEPDILELQALQALPQWPELMGLLRESSVGHPRPYPWLPASSGNLIHHAYLLQEFLDSYKLSVTNFKTVFEFGGGYGSMCRWFYSLGFTGRYAIFDIAEFNLLQEYFLKSWKPGLGLSSSPQAGSQVTLLSLPDDVKQYFSGIKPDLFMANWSLSESPLELREKIFASLPDPEYFFITFQKNFQGIDNLKYFMDLQDQKPSYKWQMNEIAHLSGNYRLYGRRRA